MPFAVFEVFLRPPPFLNGAAFFPPKLPALPLPFFMISLSFGFAQKESIHFTRPPNIGVRVLEVLSHQRFLSLISM